MRPIRFGLLSLALAACGLDVVGTETTAGPGPAEAGTSATERPEASLSEAGADADVPDSAPPEGGDPPDVDAGPRVVETIAATDLEGLRSIVVTPTNLFAARDGTVVNIKLPFTGTVARNTIDSVKNARALAIHPDGSLLFVGPDSIGRWRNDADKDTHTGEAQGVDIVFANNHILGSFGDNVNSYTLTAEQVPRYHLESQLSEGGDNPYPDGLATDGNDVWWTNREDGFVGKAGIQSKGNPWFTGMDSPSSVVVDASDLYIARVNGILKIAKKTAAGSLSAAVPFVPFDGRPVSLTGDDTYLYWLDAVSGDLYRATKATGAVTKLATTGGTGIDVAMPRLIALDSAYVYWAQPIKKTIYRIAK